MGLRGPKATPKLLTKSRRKNPWDKPGLSRADRLIAFVESLKVTSGPHAGRPFTLRPWQRDVVQAWYATDADGRRIVNTGLLTVGRKNGKTAFCAALALAHLVGPEVERRGQIIGAAKDRDQASVVFDELVAFILDNPAFIARTNIQRHAKIIEDLTSGSKFTATSSDAAKAHGKGGSVIIIDELGQWGSTQAGRDLYTALTTSTGGRDEPLTFIISTQTPDEHSVMTEMVDYAKRVKAGEILDPGLSAFVYETPMDADIWDEANWAMANPALGDFRSLKEMRTFAARAKQIPAQVNVFRAYYLNQPVRAESHWLPVPIWDEGALLEGPAEKGRKCYLGLDLASKSDLTALAYWFPNEDGTWDLYFDVWAPRGKVVQRAKNERAPYQQWVDDGWLESTPGDATDYAFIEKRIYEAMKDYQVVEVAVDPWNAQDLNIRMGQNSVPVIEVGQTLANLTTPSKAFETLILQRKIRHEGSPLVRWCIGNVVAMIDANENIKPDKRRSGPDNKIDPVSAAITGLSRALVLVNQPKSVYEQRGVMTA